MRKLSPLPLEGDALRKLLLLHVLLIYTQIGHFLVVHVYPGLFTVAGFVHAAVALSKVIASWSQSIRDKEFLVEMRLRNLESDMEQESKPEVDQAEEDEGEALEEEEEQ